MKNRILNSRFIKCDCVYSKNLKKLISVLSLIPKDCYNDTIDENYKGEYIDHFKLKETGEEFNSSDAVVQGLVDIVTKKAYIPKRVVVVDSWITEELIGESFLKEGYSKTGKRTVKIKKIEKIDFPKSIDEIKSIRGTYYEKEADLKKFLINNNKRVILEIDDSTNFGVSSDIVEIIEPYIYCRDSNNVQEAVNFLLLLDEEKDKEA